MAFRLSGFVMGGIQKDDVDLPLMEVKVAWKVMKLSVDSTFLLKGKTQPKFDSVTLPENQNCDLEDVEQSIGYFAVTIRSSNYIAESMLGTCGISVHSDLTLGEGCRVSEDFEVYGDLTVDYFKEFVLKVPATVTATRLFSFLDDLTGFEITYPLEEGIGASEAHIIQELKGDTDITDTIPSSTPSSSSSSSATCASKKRCRTEASSSSATPTSQNQALIHKTPCASPPVSRLIPIYEKPWRAPPGLNDDDIPLRHCDIRTCRSYFTFTQTLWFSRPSLDNPSTTSLLHISCAWYPFYLTSDYYTPEHELMDPFLLTWLNFCTRLGYIVVRKNFEPGLEIPVRVFKGDQLVYNLPIIRTKLRQSFLHFRKSMYFYCMFCNNKIPSDPVARNPPEPWPGAMIRYYDSVQVPIPDPRNGHGEASNDQGPANDDGNHEDNEDNEDSDDILDMVRFFNSPLMRFQNLDLDDNDPIVIDNDPEFWEAWLQNPPAAEMMDGISPADWREFIGKLHAITVVMLL